MSPPIRNPWLVAGAVSLFALLITASLPIAAVAHAVTGDALVVRLAGHLLAGEWLGAYEPGTLMAGVAYPVFVAKAAFFGVPLKVAEAGVQLAAAGAVAWVLARIGLRPMLAALMFALIAFNPAPWSPALMRVTGEAFSGSLALFALAAASFVLLTDDLGAKARRAALFAFGIAFALFWIDDAQAIWLIPALLVPAVPQVWRLIARVAASGVRGFPWDRQGAALGLDAGVAAGAFLLVTLTVAAINLFAYGAFVTGEIRGGSFAHAVGALHRITPVKTSQRFAFAAGVAANATRVSAAMRALKPHLEGAIGQKWRRAGCRRLALNPCPDGFGAGTLAHALREAAREAGQMTDAAAAEAFFAKLAREIDAACDAGDIPCGASRASLIAPVRTGQWRHLAPAAASAFDALARFGGGEAGAAASEGSDAEIAAFSAVAGVVTARADTRVELVGWVASPECLPKPVIVEGDGAVVEPEILPAEDVDKFFRAKGQVARTLRFKLKAACRESACALRLVGCEEAESVPVWSLTPGTQPPTARAVVFLDSVTGTGEAGAAAGGGWAQGASAWVASAYAAIAPVLAPFALMMFVLAWIATRDYPDLVKPLIVAGACAAAVLGRAVLVGFIDVTTMPAADLRHMAPAAPFFILFLGLSAALSLTALVRRLRASAAEGTEDNKQN